MESITLAQAIALSVRLALAGCLPESISITYGWLETNPGYHVAAPIECFREAKILLLQESR